MQKNSDAAKKAMDQGVAAQCVATQNNRIETGADRVLHRIIRRPELERVTGLPRSTIYDNELHPGIAFVPLP